MGIVELQPEEISRRARLPQQAELEVRGRCELMTAAEIKPVLVEIAFAAVEVNEGLVEGVDEVGTGLYGLVVKRYRDLQPIAPPVGVTVTVIFREPTLLESEPMLESRTYPALFHGELLIKTVFDPVALQLTGGFKRNELSKIAKLVFEKQEFLLEQWNEFFGN
jgi:hypothetical protein